MLMAAMPWGESDTRAKLIDPGLHACGWTEDLIRREETAGAVEIVEGRPRPPAKGRIDYTLRVKIKGKADAACRRLNVDFVCSSNGHMFAEFDRSSGLTSPARPLAEFPPPADLRPRYEQAVGFGLAAPASRPLVTRYAGGDEGTCRYCQAAAVRAVLA
jgi:type I restriction enzyme R subunit